MTGVRYPRELVGSPAHERLLTHLGVEIIDTFDAELEDYARAWLLDIEQVNPPCGRAGYVATAAVRRALDRIDKRKAAA